MRILVVGSGGREHALCWALRSSPQCDALLCAPGNAGIAAIADCRAVAATDLDGILKLAKAERIDFVVVGPEAPLVLGLVDHLEAHGIKCFGPTKAAAELEGSKGFTKDLCAKYGVPTGTYLRTRDPIAAKAEIRRRGAPIVVKADGLAAGKGVVVAHELDEALEAVDAMMLDRRFGDAGVEIVIEEFLAGEEVSFFALVDGTTAVPLASAQDHKAVGDGDTGPNTGGMGAYSPAPALTPEVESQVMDRIIRPSLAGMAAEGKPFKGVLFAGLMLTDKGPQLIEYNVRFGDPECEVLLRRLKSDLLPALLAARDGTLDQVTLAWRAEAALGVVIAAEGYPGTPRKGTVIAGLDAAGGAAPSVEVFHAGTAAKNGAIVADGGRVLVVTALGASVGEAQSRAYQAVDAIRWPEGFCRRDIGWRAVARERHGG
ncbi:phosphoribosylamine--glycine ligase [Aliidongia dinghuensis]|uniref:Phosphoribosylamine--glycine ligase n=1 Tax=Aliidongia dinghuensis TaxID=1867774 RepID=A0A8J2YSM1_9PROT|nr:phosphoribosylamine--glycine ligase [Aliidongia dinghuensis]GGF16062.1 phosphoribosylamine--glycine ligase [Aliidongia dinghuensis]